MIYNYRLVISFNYCRITLLPHIHVRHLLMHANTFMHVDILMIRQMIRQTSDKYSEQGYEYIS